MPYTFIHTIPDCTLHPYTLPLTSYCIAPYTLALYTISSFTLAPHTFYQGTICHTPLHIHVVMGGLHHPRAVILSNLCSFCLWKMDKFRFLYYQVHMFLVILIPLNSNLVHIFISNIYNAAYDPRRSISVQMKCHLEEKQYPYQCKF